MHRAWLVHSLALLDPLCWCSWESVFIGDSDLPVSLVQRCEEQAAGRDE